MKPAIHLTTSRGFTLLEILVAVLVLGIGLLGLAKLQTYGLHNNQSANLRTRATVLAYDISDRMRANRTAYIAAGGNFINPPAAADNNCEWDGTSVVNCTTVQMAAHDFFQWNNAITNSLPGGIGTVCLDSTPNDGGDADANGTVDAAEYACDGIGGIYAIKIWWVDEFDAAGNPVIKRFVTTFQP